MPPYPCLSATEAGTLLGGTAWAMFLVTLFVGHVQSGVPLQQLGRRPMGTGLWTYCVNYVKHSVGVKGYDSSLGAWSPPTRVAFHLAAVLAIWACSVEVLLTGWTTVASNTNDKCLLGLPVAVYQVGAAVLCGYTVLSYCYFHCLPNVSHPGGPRPHKIQRQPCWDDRISRLSPSTLSKWRCAVAQDAHGSTELEFADASPEAPTLTGEPYGRQIWTCTPPQPGPGSNKSVSETVVQEMAAGGRSEGFNPHHNPNSCDKVFRAKQIRSYLASGRKPPSFSDTPRTVAEAAHKATHFYSMLQTEDGHFAGDYGGPHFLMPGLVVAWYIFDKPERMLDPSQIELMTHYIRVHQQSDGGWGTHIESPSTMFGTTLMYLALRLMGVDRDDESCVRGRTFIQENGGAIMTSSWAKLYLCLLGCMDWDGHNSVPPEMWLLPSWCPFHPGRMWCHARMVYLPMGYLYGSRIIYQNAETDATILSLRKELYCEPYDSIPWIKTRHLVAPMDNYSPLPFVMKLAQDALARYETWSIFQPFKNFVRAYGLKFCAEYMAAEDRQTNYIDIGPVNKVFNMISAYHVAGNNPDDPCFVMHMMRIPDYLWVAEDGMKMQGYNGSQCWDTSFAIQAIYESGLLDEFPDVSTKVWDYLERCQILSTSTSQASPAYTYESEYNRNKYYRHVSQGGWPFSTSAHGWPISDCTGEGLKGVLCLAKSQTIAKGLRDGTLQPVSEARLQDAVNVILTLQNEDGGWATYENNRGFGWYEQLNPSEVFGDIMIDYSYVECSMASLTALAEFRSVYPDHRAEEISHSMAKGRNFMKSIQRDDGSWYGSWACCFCYGCWFGIEGLVQAGEDSRSPAIQKACQFLLSHQRPNGGWGEDFSSCYDKEYAERGMDAYGDEGSGVVNTGWALLALSVAQCEDVDAIRRGVRYLMRRQLPSGDWPQEGIAGVFNRACGITYTAYRNVFPLWALGRCAATYGDVLNEEAS